MGWLKDLMQTSAAPIPSFGRLAQLCLEHPDWPRDSRIKERSLSTLFSKIDRGLEVEWLRERPAVQRLLAQLMNRAPTEIRLAIGEPSVGTNERMLRLHDVRYARDIDLTREPLPPGIPPAAYDPPSWGPTVWLAPSGSGRSLAGAWLHARGLARSALLRSASDLDRVPTRGPLFVEVRGGVPVDGRLLERLRVSARPVLLAGSFGGGHGRSLDFSPTARANTHELPEVLRSFITIRSPHVEEYLPELVDWVHARLNPEGHFDPDAVEDWMRRVAIPSGAVRHLGDALGLLGMLDELSPKMRAGRRLSELASAFVRHRIREATDRDTFGPKVAEETYVALENAATRCLVLQGQSIAEPRSESEWTAVLAEQTTDESPDPAWFQTALRTTLGRSVSRKELRRATKLLPPRAFQLARALEHAELLRPVLRHASARDAEETDSYELGPHFLVRLLEAHAENDALSFSASEWGALLRHPNHRDRIFEALLSRALREEWDAHYAAIDDEREPNPSQTAAIEAAFATLTFAVVAGRRPPHELERALVRAFSRSLVPLGASFEPRVAPVDGVSYGRSALLAAWACRRDELELDDTSLDAASEIPAPRALPERSRELFESSLDALEEHAERGALPPALTALLFERLGKLASDRPRRGALAEFLGKLSGTEASMEELRDAFLALGGRYSAAEFSGLLAGQGLRTREVFSRLWRAVGARETPEVWPELLSEFWASLPLEVLEERVRADGPLDWSRIPPHRLEAWAHRSALPLPRETVARLPLEAILASKTRLFDYRAEAVALLPTAALVRLYREALEAAPETLAPYLPPPETASFEILADLRAFEEPTAPGHPGAVAIALSLLRSGSEAADEAHALLERIRVR